MAKIRSEDMGEKYMKVTAVPAEAGKGKGKGKSSSEGAKTGTSKGGVKSSGAKPSGAKVMVTKDMDSFSFMLHVVREQ